MPYDANFYRMYRKYLEEPMVRQNHDRIFGLFASFLLPESPQVIDFGCGLGEYAIYDSRHSAYIGIDHNRENHNTSFIFIQADYLSLAFSSPLPPNAFVSLFSIENCHPLAVKYDFYERVFAAFPTIRCGLTGGFFYESRRDQETVTENGELVSYQTIEDASRHISSHFVELRTHLYTPSEMFGRDVVEVWKFLVRK